MLKRTNTLLLHLCLLFSCNALPPGSEFPDTIQYVSEEQVTDGVYMRYPFRIRKNDSCLYVMDLHASGYYCHQLCCPEMKLIASYGKRGEAPEELLDAENIRLDATGRLYMLDANKKKIQTWMPPDAQSSKSISLSEDLVRTLDFCFYQDSLLIVPDYTGESRFCIINQKGEIVERRGSIPLREEHEISTVALAQIWRPFLDYKPSNGVLALVTQLGDVLEIYNLRNDSSTVVYGPGKEPQFIYRSGLAVPSGIMGYSDVQVGEERIYALFWGQTFEEIRRSKDDRQGGRYIHVFDLQGKPIEKYELDRLITGFCLDEATGCIWGVDVNSDTPIIKFRKKTTTDHEIQ